MPKNMKDIKKLIILIVLLIIVAIIGLIVFLFNVDIKNPGKIDLIQQMQNNTENQNTNYSDISENNIETPKDDENLQYSIVKTDIDGIYQIALSDNKLYLRILDSDIFFREYKNSELSAENYNEINSSDFKIKDFNIGKIGNKNYLVLYTVDQEFTLLNIDEAIESNDFSNYSEKIFLGKDISKIENAIVRKESGEEIETMIICSKDNKNYDLSNFVEKND